MARMFPSGCIVCFLLQIGLGASPSLASEPRYFPGSTVKLSQLTGDWDAPRRLKTTTLTETRAGIVATDLGSSFEHKGKLYFLFGDTWGRPGDRDVLAWTENTSPEGLTLGFHKDDDGTFLPITIPGISQGAFEVPSYGISVQDRMYIVFTTDHSRPPWTMGRSVLAVSDDDGRTFTALHDVSRKHFINVALASANRETYPDLPAAQCVLVWGSGKYRASSPRLACIPSRDIGRAEALRYFHGTSDEETGMWSTDEADAVELFHHPVIGELSAGWIPALERWVMLYNSTAPRGIVMRTAALPWGPWSEPTILFNPWRDMGYGRFIHQGWGQSRIDAFEDPGHEWSGGEYGPYLIPRFTQGTSERCTIFFTMSTWNPYQVVLMSADVGYPERRPSRDPVEVHTLPGDRGWSVTGFISEKSSRNGVPYVTTRGPAGDAEMGVAHYGFAFTGDDGNLSFSLRGGEGEVVLIVEKTPPPTVIGDIPAFYRRLKAGDFGRVVEAMAGPKNDDLEVTVRWNLRRHTGKKLRLLVVDHLTGRWGSLDVSPFTITENRMTGS